MCLTVALASTFAGSAVACAAANAVLGIYEDERIVENARVRGEQLLAGLFDLKQRHPLIGDVQGKGLYAAIEFVRDRTTKEPAARETVFMHTECVPDTLMRFGSYLYNTIAFPGA